MEILIKLRLKGTVLVAFSLSIGFLMFSGFIKWEHRLEISESYSVLVRDGSFAPNPSDGTISVILH